MFASNEMRKLFDVLHYAIENDVKRLVHEREPEIFSITAFVLKNKQYKKVRKKFIIKNQSFGFGKITVWRHKINKRNVITSKRMYAMNK
jgi:hypothetical protein